MSPAVYGNPAGNIGMLRAAADLAPWQTDERRAVAKSAVALWPNFLGTQQQTLQWALHFEPYAPDLLLHVKQLGNVMQRKQPEAY